MVIEPSSAVSAAPARASFTGVAPPRPERAEHVDDHAGQPGAGEGEPHVARQRRHAERVDADDDGQRGAGVDAEHAGVGQRVAGDALHQRPGQPEGGADPEPEQRAGDAQLAHDQVVGRAVAVDERLPHRAERDRLGAEGDRAHGDDGRGPRGPRPGRPPAASRRRAAASPSDAEPAGRGTSASRGASMTAVTPRRPSADRARRRQATRTARYQIIVVRVTEQLRRSRCERVDVSGHPVTVIGRAPCRARMAPVQSTGAIAPDGRAERARSASWRASSCR